MSLNPWRVTSIHGRHERGVEEPLHLARNNPNAVENVIRCCSGLAYGPGTSLDSGSFLPVYRLCRGRLAAQLFSSG
jgi:hypothetical protein